jgi:hypothetical protein
MASLRGGGDGFGLADTEGETAIEATERGLGAAEVEGCESQDGRGTVGGRLGLGADQTTAGHLVLGSQCEPRREVTLARPAAHVGPDLRDQTQSAKLTDAIDLGEIVARELVEQTADFEARIVLAAVFVAAREQGRLRRLGFLGELLKIRIDGTIDDTYAEQDRDGLMFGGLTAGERRVWRVGQATLGTTPPNH